MTSGVVVFVRKLNYEANDHGLQARRGRSNGGLESRLPIQHWICATRSVWLVDDDDGGGGERSNLVRVFSYNFLATKKVATMTGV